MDCRRGSEQRTDCPGRARRTAPLRLISDDGVLIVYNAPASEKVRPYLIYWNDFASAKLHVYDRLVLRNNELGSVVRALQSGLQISENSIVELSATSELTSQIKSRSLIQARGRRP